MVLNELLYDKENYDVLLWLSYWTNDYKCYCGTPNLKCDRHVTFFVFKISLTPYSNRTHSIKAEQNSCHLKSYLYLQWDVSIQVFENTLSLILTSSLPNRHLIATMLIFSPYQLVYLSFHMRMLRQVTETMFSYLITYLCSSKVSVHTLSLTI